MRRPSLSLPIMISTFAFGILGGGCSSNNPPDDRAATTGAAEPDGGKTSSNGGGGESTVGTDTGGISSTGGGITVPIDDAAPPVSDGASNGDGSATCASTVTRGEPTPLDLFIAMDQSRSMDDDPGDAGDS